MALAGPAVVHLIVGSGDKHTGIGRYCTELHKRISRELPVRVCSFRKLPGAGRLSFLEHLPLGVEPDEGAGIYHFTRIMGCSLMLWRPLHPSVATVHDLGPLVCPEEAASVNAFDGLLLRLSLAGLKCSDRIVTRSEYTRQTVCTHLRVDPQRVHVTPGGIDTERFRPIAGAKIWLAERYGLARDDGVYNLLYVGTEAPRKNLGVLLQSMAVLKRQHLAMRLLKVGGPGHPRARAALLAQIEELGLERDVLFLGAVADDELPRLYSAADLVVLPSLVEGLGLPVLEGMACGSPVVCSDAGALPEVAADAAVVVDPRDVQGLAEAIAAVAQNVDLRERLVQKGLHRVRGFSWAKTAGSTMLVYENVVLGQTHATGGASDTPEATIS